MPELADVGGEAGDRDRVLDAYVAMLGRAASSQLVWLWLEDLQWADRGTRALLAYVLKTTAVGRLFVSCTLRTEVYLPSVRKQRGYFRNCLGSNTCTP